MIIALIHGGATKGYGGRDYGDSLKMHSGIAGLGTNHHRLILSMPQDPDHQENLNFQYADGPSEVIERRQS